VPGERLSPLSLVLFMHSLHTKQLLKHKA